MPTTISIFTVPEFSGTKNIPAFAPDQQTWLLKIHTLGTFGLVRNGVPLHVTGKAPRKPLKLYKALIAFGGREISQDRLLDSLWPDADGGYASPPIRDLTGRRSAMNNTTMNRIIENWICCTLLTVLVAVCAPLFAGCNGSNAVVTTGTPDTTSGPGTINEPDTTNDNPGTTSVPLADPLASGKTRAVYTYLYNLPNGSSKRILSGQYAESMSDTTGIFNTTGKNVALLGMDYAWAPLSDAEIIAWSDAGGLVTVGQHFKNPATGGDVFDTTSVDMIELVTEGTALNTTFKGYLDTLATHLTVFQNANAVIILRLFHEMNGGWFWWGGKDPAQFKHAWMYTYNYLTNTKGLHNLIWNWSPYQVPSTGILDTTYYPGAAYVDIAGISIYGQGNVIPAITGIPDNKPFAVNEWGYHTGGMTYQYSSYPPANIAPMISSLKTNMPNAVYWMAWNGIYSMNYNTSTSTFLADPLVITRDEIPAFRVTATPFTTK